MYEQKKLDTIVDFIAQHNHFTLTTEEGFHMTSKALSQDEFNYYSVNAYEAFKEFYLTYFSLTFFLPTSELLPFEKIYVGANKYFSSVKERQKLIRDKVFNPGCGTELSTLRDEVLACNRENVRVIGTYFRKFLVD